MPETKQQEFSIRAITDFGELADCATQWSNLFRRSSNASPMQSFGWMYEYLRWKSRSSIGWSCFVAESSSGWLAALAVVEDKSESARAKVLRVSCGAHLNIGDVLIDDKADDAVIAAILQYSIGYDPKTAYLVLPRVPSYSKSMSFAVRQTEMHVLIRAEVSGGSYLAPISSLDSYEETLTRKFRSNLARARRKLSQIGRVEFEVITNGLVVGETLRRFARLEGSGWKGRAGTSLDSNPDLLEFYKNALGRLSGEGLVEWHFLKVGETDLAAQLAFRLDSRLVLWKACYDESRRKLSPGSLLRQETIRWEARKKHPVEIDPTTTHDWHRDWQMSSRHYYQIRIYNKKSLAGLAAFFRDRIVIFTKQFAWLRKVNKILRR